MALVNARFGAAAQVLSLGILLSACASGGSAPQTAPVAQSAVGVDAGGEIVPRLVRMGDQAVARGDTASAVLLFGQAWSENRNDTSVAIKLGDALHAEGRHSEALEIFRSVLAYEPDHADASRGFARVQIAFDRPAIAVDQLERALRQHGSDARLWTTMGVARDLNGNHRLARQAYDRALALDPGNLGARNNRALSLALDGEVEQAIAELRAITDGPSANAQSRQNLAFVYALAGDLHKAENLSYLDLNESAVRNNVAFFQDLPAGAPVAPRSLKPSIGAAHQSRGDKRDTVEAAPVLLEPAETTKAPAPVQEPAKVAKTEQKAILVPEVSEPVRTAKAAAEPSEPAEASGHHNLSDPFEPFGPSVAAEAAASIEVPTESLEPVTTDLDTTMPASSAMPQMATALTSEPVENRRPVQAGTPIPVRGKLGTVEARKIVAAPVEVIETARTATIVPAPVEALAVRGAEPSMPAEPDMVEVSAIEAVRIDRSETSATAGGKRLTSEPARGDATPAPDAAFDTSAWLPPLEPFAPSGTDVSADVADDDELWLLDLGEHESEIGRRSTWRRLRERHADVLGIVDRFDEAGEGLRPLVAGPVASETEANSICAALQAASTSCEPRKL